MATKKKPASTSNWSYDVTVRSEKGRLLCLPFWQRFRLTRTIRRKLLDLSVAWTTVGYALHSVAKPVVKATLVEWHTISIGGNHIRLGLIGRLRIRRAIRTRLAYDARKAIEK